MDKNCWGNLGLGFLKFSMFAKLFKASNDLEHIFFPVICLVPQSTGIQLQHHSAIISYVSNAF